MPADEQHQQGQDRGEDRPADEEIDHGDRARGTSVGNSDRRGLVAQGLGAARASSSAFTADLGPPGSTPPWAVLVAAPAGRGAGPGRAARLAFAASRDRPGEDRRLGLDRHAGPDQLQPLDDHRDARVEPLGDDPQALVRLRRLDPLDRHLAAADRRCKRPARPGSPSRPARGRRRRSRSGRRRSAA